MRTCLTRKWYNREALSFNMKDTTIDVHFAHVNPWLFIIPTTKPPFDFAHLLLKCGSRTEAIHLYTEKIKNNQLATAKITIVNYVF